MSPARAQLLRQNAASLKLKAVTGEVAVAAARDLSVRLPKALLARIECELKSGELEKRWQKCIEEAEQLGPDAEMGALAALMTEFAKQIGNEARAFADELEATRQRAFGRAQGLEEALEALDSPPKEDAASGADT